MKLDRISVADSIRYQRMTTEEMRAHFLLPDLFLPGAIQLTLTDVDRAIVGSAMPASAPLTLGPAPELRAEYFLERRELGILNIGGAGRVTVDESVYAMAPLDGLYLGRGTRDIRFESVSAAEPAAFYLLSYPAHAAYPTAHARKADAEAVPLGETALCNRRTIYKYIHPRGIRSCQLVMGFTVLEEGSAWNTMPPHTHERRSEIYLYFNMAEEARVFHFMGSPRETRHLLLGNREAVISPAWSIHAGAGTARYSFCWGMGGENQTFEDMDAASVAELR
ncbi:MAG TPA: 5-dehydro-4-deoxy-D-glucuronate isomerase [Chthoniobacteraceae bacterium]|jgi:4-deoxy-L-threo-5-hexosulose-uronate ketol-isomerase|nr:5-dehydro-4-deoxy-D-glucuronate isomerase [Chthoniobacteraceae bacterium]